MDKITISVVGLGYVGLVTAVGFGLRGHKVVGIEIDSNKIDKINRGISPIHEPGIEEAMKKISLDASSDYEAILGSDITFICIDAPVSSDGAPHLNHLIQAVEQMAERLKEKRGNHTVALRTSVTPGTTEESVVPILEKAGDFEICVNPEFMSEGQALADFMNPSRIIIGECDGASDNALLAIYQDFNRPILRTDSKTAEMIKYASNTFLATKVSFINEMGNICKRLGIDAFEVAKGMRGDKRIGSLFLNPGIGFGGSCLPKDTRALIGTARKLGYEPRILEGVLRLNTFRSQAEPSVSWDWRLSLGRTTAEGHRQYQS